MLIEFSSSRWLGDRSKVLKDEGTKTTYILLRVCDVCERVYYSLSPINKYEKNIGYIRIEWYNYDPIIRSN